MICKMRKEICNQSISSFFNQLKLFAILFEVHWHAENKNCSFCLGNIFYLSDYISLFGNLKARQSKKTQKIIIDFGSIFANGKPQRNETMYVKVWTNFVPFWFCYNFIFSFFKIEVPGEMYMTKKIKKTIKFFPIQQLRQF